TSAATTPASPATPPASPQPLDPSQLRDFLHVSESFRHAALLYLERLANPQLPSSHPSIQNLVNKALYYITSIDSSSGMAKFLLWPLFITGTECTADYHRSIIRQRCWEI